jgi:predicted small secreted protein
MTTTQFPGSEEVNMLRKNVATALLTLFTLAGAASVLSACNTMEGLGRDTSAAGQALTNTSSNVQRKM